MPDVHSDQRELGTEILLPRAEMEICADCYDRMDTSARVTPMSQRLWFIFRLKQKLWLEVWFSLKTNKHM